MLSLAQKFCDLSNQYKFSLNKLFNFKSDVFSFAFILSEVQYYFKNLQYGEQIFEGDGKLEGQLN